jgi:hypothetical protein
MSNFALDVVEVNAGRTILFGGVYAANDGYYAEIHEQKEGRIRRLEKSSTLPNRDVAVVWMNQTLARQSAAA